MLGTVVSAGGLTESLVSLKCCCIQHICDQFQKRCYLLLEWLIFYDLKILMCLNELAESNNQNQLGPIIVYISLLLIFHFWFINNLASMDQHGFSIFHLFPFCFRWSTLPPVLWTSWKSWHQIKSSTSERPFFKYFLTTWKWTGSQFQWWKPLTSSSPTSAFLQLRQNTCRLSELENLSSDVFCYANEFIIYIFMMLFVTE